MDRARLGRRLDHASAAPSELQRNEEAVQASQGAGDHVTNPDKIGYLLAALGSEAMPAASPVQYVRDLFDKYARRFDDQLVSQLNYRVPELLAAQLQPLVEATGLGVLDLGCGTGLCRPWLKPWAGSLTGLDVSAKMLEEAARKGVYDRLVAGEINAYLQTCSACFDLIVAAAVFIYIGDLSGVFAGVCRACVRAACLRFRPRRAPTSISASRDRCAMPTRRRICSASPRPPAGASRA